MVRQSVSILVPRGDHFLVVARPDGSGFCPPGGKVERGESLVAAAVRELLEETGIVAGPKQLLSLWMAGYENRDVVTTVFELTSPYEGSPISPEELELRWMTWERLCMDVFGDFYRAIPFEILVSRGLLRRALVPG